jgi:hypothetical protein
MNIEEFVDTLKQFLVDGGDDIREDGVLIQIEGNDQLFEILEIATDHNGFNPFVKVTVA